MLEKLEESFTAMWENISAWLARIEHRLDSFEKKVLEIHIRLEVLNKILYRKSIEEGL